MLDTHHQPGDYASIHKVKAPNMTELIETRRKRLLYKANYRGFREADLLIGGFAKAHLAGMGEAELDEFEALLKLNDRDLFDWATGKREAPANMAGPVFDRLCKFDIAGVIHGAAQD